MQFTTIRKYQSHPTYMFYYVVINSAYSKISTKKVIILKGRVIDINFIFLI